MRTGLLRFRDYRDKKVENPWGEHLGSINDMVLDAVSGRVAYVVLTHGGFWGFGGKRFAVAIEDLKPTYNGHRVFLSVHRQALKRLHGLDKRSWSDAPDPEFAAAILGATRSS